MKNNKKLRALILCCLFLFSGCWDYIGLDQIDIVTGIAIDRPDPDGLYHITLEIINTQSKEGSESQVKYLEVSGINLFDTFRNAKRRLSDKLYGGNMELVIISKQIAETEGVFYVVEELLRDNEPRETLSIAISMEPTAKEVLFTKGVDSEIISFEIAESLQEDASVTLSTRNVPLYMIYNYIKGEGGTLTLPAVRIIENIKNDENPSGEEIKQDPEDSGAGASESDEEKESGDMGSQTQNIKDKAFETYGVAYFKEDILKGFLSPEETKYLLFIIDEVKNGDFSIPDENGELRVSFEIVHSKTKSDLKYENGKLYLDLDITSTMNMTALDGFIDFNNYEARRILEARCEDYLSEQVKNLFENTQEKIGMDIYNLGSKLYQSDFEKWEFLKADWDRIFCEAEIYVKSHVVVSNTGEITNY